MFGQTGSPFLKLIHLGVKLITNKMLLLIAKKCKDVGSCTNKQMFVDVAREGVNLLVIPFKTFWENNLSKKCHIASLYTTVHSASLPHKIRWKREHQGEKQRKESSLNQVLTSLCSPEAVETPIGHFANPTKWLHGKSSLPTFLQK